MYGISIGPLMRQYIVVIIVNLCTLTTGLGLAWPSPVLVKLRNSTESVLSTPLSENDGSWIVSIGSLSGLPPVILISYLVDSIGRKYCIILSCIPKIVAGFLYVYASEVWQLLLGRALLGVADAIVFTIVPMYASEVADKEIRGSLGTILQLLCSLGVVTMLCMGPFLPYMPLNVIYLSCVVASSLPLVFIPDSPYFLYSKGKNKEAVKALTFLRGTEILAKEELKDYALLNNKVDVNKWELFKNRVFLKSFFIVLVLTMGSQLIGFNSISFYLQTVLESTQTTVRPEIASVVIGCIQLLASICTALISDKFGRKPIFAATLTGMALGMVGLGIFFRLKELGPISGVINFLPIASLIMVVFGYSAGVGSLNWILGAELFDDTGRGVGLSLTGITSYISLFFMTKYFPALTNNLGPAVTYWLFGVNTITLCLFILFCVPETKGKSFLEIQAALGARINTDVKESNSDDKI